MTIDNKYLWNSILLRYCGYIIAFIALFFMSYVMFMGAYYDNGGKLLRAAILVIVIDIALVICFIGIRLLKGAKSDFTRALTLERVFIVLSSIVFIVAMIPYNHFWHIFGQRKEVTTQFNEALTDTRQMFAGYEQYAENRINNYDETLNRIAGSKKNGNAVTRANRDLYLQALRLQLISENTDSIKNMATRWTEKAGKKASVWNPFLMGNINQISKAVKGWQARLEEQSLPRMSQEEANGAQVKSFAECDSTAQVTLRKLDNLSHIYTKSHGLSFMTIWTGMILLFMLSLPYLLQTRNPLSTSTYHNLLPKTQKEEKPAEPTNDDQNIFNGPL